MYGFFVYVVYSTTVFINTIQYDGCIMTVKKFAGKDNKDLYTFISY